MKNKLIAMLTTAIISVGVIGGGAFASSIDKNSKDNQPTVVKESSLKTNYNQNSINNPSKDIYEDMRRTMGDDGFKDATRYIQTGNHGNMTEYMDNLTQEEYDKMIEVMNEKGYGNMRQRMGAIGRRGMLKRHNSMMRNSSNFNCIMDGF